MQVITMAPIVECILFGLPHTLTWGSLRAASIAMYEVHQTLHTVGILYNVFQLSI